MVLSLLDCFGFYPVFDFSPDSDQMTFHWRKHHYGQRINFSRKQHFEVKNTLMMDLFLSQSFSLHKLLTDGLEWCGVFISSLGSHSDGTHSLDCHFWVSYS